VQNVRSKPELQWQESKVTKLLEMNLVANRARAIRMLDYTANNLDLAIVFLLAQKDRLR
jgi:hypothetical protein